MWVKTGEGNLVETDSSATIGIVPQSTPDIVTVQLAPSAGGATALVRDLTHPQALAVVERLAGELGALDLAAVVMAVPGVEGEAAA